MIRSFGAVLAGVVTWSVVWLAANATAVALVPQAFGEDGTTSSTGILVLFLVLSVLASILAGWVTAAVARRPYLGPTLVLGGIQLAIGIGVQMQYWDAMPLWYHLPFLALLVPGNVAGGWIRSLRDAG